MMRISKKTPERQRDDDKLMKVRSARSVAKTAFTTYTAELKQLVRALAIHILDTAVVATAVGMLTVYGQYLFAPLAVLALVLELVLWLITARWMTGRPVRSLFRPARRHWLLLLGVVVAWWLLLLLPGAVVSLPLCVLVLAEFDSQASIMVGDPQSMPAYMPYLTAVVWFVTSCLLLTMRLLIVYIAYYAWGSAETRRREYKQKISIQ